MWKTENGETKNNKEKEKVRERKETFYFTILLLLNGK